MMDVYPSPYLYTTLSESKIGGQWLFREPQQKLNSDIKTQFQELELDVANKF